MLSRAILPLARARPVPSSALRVPIITSSPSFRSYAQNNKPRTPYVLPGQKPKKDQAKPKSNSKNAQSKAPKNASAEPSSEPDISPEQPEFDTVAQDKQQEKQQDTPQTQKPLPDLTQGIPSTLGAELDAARKGRPSSSLNLTEDPSHHEEYEERGSGDRSNSAYESSLDRRRARVANVMYAILLGAGVGGTLYLGRNWDSDEEARHHKDAPSGWGVGLFWDRIKARLDGLTSYYKDPAFEKLLPDEDESQRQPYTLVLSLEDLLVFSEWTREHGWRVAKRPGVDYFLRYLNQYYELVLFTSVPSMMADQVLRKLDPFRIIRWPLFREATKYKDGEYVKV